jgi:hypothetical protein
MESKVRVSMEVKCRRDRLNSMESHRKAGNSQNGSQVTGEVVAPKCSKGRKWQLILRPRSGIFVFCIV